MLVKLLEPIEKNRKGDGIEKKGMPSRHRQEYRESLSALWDSFPEFDCAGLELNDGVVFLGRDLEAVCEEAKRYYYLYPGKEPLLTYIKYRPGKKTIITFYT